MSVEPISTTFRQQGEMCGSLGSPFMEQLLCLVADNLHPGNAVMDRLLNWGGDARGRADSVPLRFAGGLHALVLQGHDAGLAAVYPPNSADDVALWQAVKAALKTHATFLLDWLESPPQTNEVRRSVALIPTGLLLTKALGLPLTLSELGASGGLNLNFDRFALQAGAQQFGAVDPVLLLKPDWEGYPPEAGQIMIAERRGVDLNPLTGSADANRLRAYLWPDQPHRRALTDAALACDGRHVDRGDVTNWLEERLNRSTLGTTHLIYHTVAWQYFPPHTQAACTALIEEAGERATSDAPLAWMGMEADDVSEDGACLTLRIWPGDRRIALGRADFHGRWVRWTPKEQ